MTYNNHFGIYGVSISNNKLLCIRRNRGPYNNRYDLPGGSPKNNEGFLDTLIREIKEETGFIIKSIKKSRAYDFFVEINSRKVIEHHMALFYDIELEEKFQEIKEKLIEEVNDSRGFIWVDISELDITNSSPLVLKVKDEILGDDNALNTKYYKNWIEYNN